MSRLVGGNREREKLTRAVDITQHDGGDVDSEDVVATMGVRDRARCLRGCHTTTYASVKKPTPATKQTLMWNHL